MRFLKTNTAVRVTIGPFLDKTDGITPEVALTATNEKLTFMVDTGGVPTLVLDVNATASGGNNDMVHVTGDDAGFYDLELAAANVNYVGPAMLSINYVTDHCPVFHEFMILPAVVYDSLVGGTDTLQTDMIQILGTAVSTPATAGVLDVNIKNIDNDAASASGTVTFPNATLASTTNITGGTITTVTNLTNAPTAGDLTATMKASVNAEAVDALNVDTYAEPAQGAPAATTTLVTKIGHLYKAFRNRKRQTATLWELLADDETTVDQKATVSDDGTTAIKTEIVGGP